MIARKFDNDLWELSEILNLIKNELEAKKRSSFMLSNTSDQYQDHMTAALLVKGSTEHKTAYVFCNKENHISHKCLKMSNPKTRFSILRRKKLCFICFKGGHLSVNCSKFKDYKCETCSAKYNISVCSGQAIPVATPAEELQDTNTTLANFNNKNILLQTDYAKLSSFNSSKTNDVRIIFDAGSEKTYATNDVKKYLHLPTLGTERIFVNTFGNYDSEPRTVDVVPLKFIANGKTIVIESLCATYICSKMFGQNVRHASLNNAHLKNIKLTDPFDTDCKKIDILIGLDSYFKFMTGNICRCNENEPIALESYFGWVVSNYCESPFSTTTNSFTNFFLKTNFYDIDYMKNDGNIFKLIKETFFNVASDQCESNKSREFISQFKNN